MRKRVHSRNRRTVSFAVKRQNHYFFSLTAVISFTNTRKKEEQMGKDL